MNTFCALTIIAAIVLVGLSALSFLIAAARRRKRKE